MIARLGTGPEAIADAAERLLRGEIVAFPTETVYGLGARADRSEAVRKIFEAKGRPPNNPLIVHVEGVDHARAIASEWSATADVLAKRFWPGPLTLIVTARPGSLASEVSAGGPSIAIRVPSHPVALELLRKVALPIAAPSANRSTSVSPTLAAHVMKDLGDRIDAVIDGGATAFGIESTIVDARAGAALIRPGAVSLAAIEALLPIEDRSGAVVPPSERAIAPGGLARHYAPRAELVVVRGEDVARAVEVERERGRRVASIERGTATARADLAEVLPNEAQAYAHELYAALHRADGGGMDVIVIASVPESPEWAAVRDRLRRGSA